MKKMKLYFDAEKIKTNWLSQSGTEYYPDLATKRTGVLTALGLDNAEPSSIDMDFESQTVKLGFSPTEVRTIQIEDMAEREGAVLQAINFVNADMNNSFVLFNAFVNGQIPKGVLEKALDLECQTNEANEIVTDFVQMLGLNNN